MDNLSTHKSPAVRAAVEAAGARLLFLPPYSLDLNPIENAFAKLKALLLKAAARTLDQPWKAIADIIQTYSPRESRNDFTATAYDADRSENALE
jgi:transposase